MSDQQVSDLQAIIGRQEEELAQAQLREVALTERCERLERVLREISRVQTEPAYNEDHAMAGHRLACCGGKVRPWGYEHAYGCLALKALAALEAHHE